MTHIFTYGSLMFDQIWRRVVAGDYQKTTAVLKGYDRKRVRGESYPVIYPSAIHSQVPGIVYFNVSAADLEKLDIFEGEYYDRKNALVATHEGKKISAAVYVLREEFYPIISFEDWDAAHFEKVDMQRFIDSYIGFVDGDRKVH